MTNLIKTGALLAALTAVFVVTGFLIAGKAGMIAALLMAVAINAFAYWFSADMLLRAYGARKITRASDPQLYGLVADLAARAALPTPRVYLIDSQQPNAPSPPAATPTTPPWRSPPACCASSPARNWPE